MRIFGNRALLFTDIEGSTALLQRVGPLFFDLLDEHHLIMRECISQCAGVDHSLLNKQLADRTTHCSYGIRPRRMPHFLRGPSA